jgi:uncharacterized protein
MSAGRLTRQSLLLLALTGVLVLWCAGAALGLEAFKITRYLSDQAGLLSQAQGDRIAGLLADYAQKTGNQLLVVTVPALEGEELTDYAERLFERNHPGEKGKDNGLIMVIARDERKIRLEVGYGLEAAVPDGKAGTIIRDEITPRFKEGDYYSGIVSGITAIITAVSPDYTFSSGGTLPVRERKRDNSLPSALVVALVIFLFTAFGNMRERQYHRSRRSRGFSEPWYWGGGGGFGGGSGGFGGGSDGGFSGGGGGFGGGGAGSSW